MVLLIVSQFFVGDPVVYGLFLAAAADCANPAARRSAL
jgi:hypothetical protein